MQNLEPVGLHSAIDVDEFVSESTSATIIDSHTFRDGEWRALTMQENTASGITKCVVPVDISSAQFLVMTEVAPRTAVESHRHGEPILRLVVSGSLTLNGTEYRTGDWVYVPAGVDYRIDTEAGYTTVAGYGVPCD
ncbi:cupin domain-containing protein [Nocardia alba]|uniref:ChrR-like cupin domain-containing protein n=1 Tax=Nocardia alba TaxID=225051 RepID=A0A4R1FBP2_9NOCA|nr:hypothetical protein [Nocardia alba]TCJ89398.1 hypothetical protein DFR71_6609 [Nocardia alba]